MIQKNAGDCPGKESPPCLKQQMEQGMKEGGKFREMNNFNEEQWIVTMK